LTRPLDPEVKKERELERLRIENSRLRNINRKLFRSTDILVDEVVSELRNVLLKESKFEYKTKIEPVKTQNRIVSKDHSEIAVSVLSDWHGSEDIRLNATSGINQYNSVVMANRAYELAIKEKQILSLHSSIYKISKIFMPILGDQVGGSIHSDLSATNDLSDPCAVVLTSRIMIMFVEEMKTLGIPIDISCISGNHGRILPKMPFKAQASFTYDYIVYEILAEHFKNDPLVTIEINPGQFGERKLFDWVYRFEHGYNLKSGDSQKLEDKIRAMFDDTIARQATGFKGASFDQIMVGHLHESGVKERVVKNGALSGTGELGFGLHLRPCSAQQTLFGVSKDHVKTWHYFVDVTRIISNKSCNAFSQYATEFMKKFGR
jgi:hypothetical protein